MSTLVADTPKPVQPPPRTTRACFTPPQVAAELGRDRSSVWRELQTAPTDGSGRVVSGIWKGAYQTATGRWHIPPAVLASVKASEGRTAAVVDLTTRMDLIEERLRYISDELTRLRAMLLLPERRTA